MVSPYFVDVARAEQGHIAIDFSLEQLQRAVNARLAAGPQAK
jgi:hypothetical protein